MIGQDGKPFCQLCQRSLHDFRGRSLKEVLDYTSQNKGCGVFDPEHVYDDPIPLLSFSSVRRFAAAVATFFAAETSFAQSNQDIVADTTLVYPLNTTDVAAKSTVAPQSLEKAPMTDRQVRKYWKKWNEKSAYRTDYGLFYRRRFPFFSFKNHIVLRPVVSFWHEKHNQEIKRRRDGLIFFSKFNKK